MDPLAGIQDGLAGSLKRLQGETLGGDASKEAEGSSKVGRSGFGSILDEGLQEVVGLQKDSQEKTRGLITGETQDINQVLIANEKAGVAFEMMLEVRNKLMAAWKEITRLQV